MNNKNSRHVSGSMITNNFVTFYVIQLPTSSLLTNNLNDENSVAGIVTDCV